MKTSSIVHGRLYLNEMKGTLECTSRLQSSLRLIVTQSIL